MNPTAASARRSARSLIVWIIAGLLLGFSAQAQSSGKVAHGTVHTDTLWSQSLGLRKALRVYLPPSYANASGRRYPVLFYLHGLTGNETNWTDQAHLQTVLDSLVASGQPEAIVAMPDGDDGWYTTAGSLVDLPGCRADTTRKEPAETYCVPWMHYDDYVARDLVAWVDRRYRVLKGPRHHGVAGLSMGGYGAVTLALAYPDVFGAAASHSGVLAPLYSGPKPYAEPVRYAHDSVELRQAARGLWRSQRIAFGADTIGWWSRDPGRLAMRARARVSANAQVTMPALRIDCGTEDPYIDQNRAFHATLGRIGVSHEYAEWPGTHDWNYWRAHLPESLVFLLAATREGKSQ